MGRNLPNSKKPVVVEQTTTDGSPTATSLTEYTEFKKSIADKPALVTGYQKLLKAANFYKGPINGKYTPAFQKALDNAEAQRMSIQAIRPLGRDEFLQEQVQFGSGSGGTGQARTVTQMYEVNDTDAEALITKLYKQLTGYGPTAKQLAEAKKDLRKQEKLNPVKQAYDAKGNLSQTGGFNEEQYLTSQIGQTGAAQKSRATTANELLLNELGGLR